MFLSLYLLSLSSSFYTSEIYTFFFSNKIFIVFCVLRLHHLEDVSTGGKKIQDPHKAIQSRTCIGKTDPWNIFTLGGKPALNLLGLHE